MSTSTQNPSGNSPHFVVLGAGSIGGYIGGCLLATGTRVTLLGRAKARDTAQAHGYTLTDLHQRQVLIPAANIRFSIDPQVLQLADVVLVTVKSRDTPEAAALLKLHAKPHTTVISFQNGIGNSEQLANLLPHLNVIAGMVPFNVVTLPRGHLHCGTEGQLCAENNSALWPLRPIFEHAGLPLQSYDNFQQVQWGKLILNLNNAVNALSDLPLKQELSQHAYRKCLALLIDETLRVLKKANIKPAKISKASPFLLPAILRLPNFIFKRLAGSMLKIDEQARSSMWEDLQLGRTTEVNELNGAVVELAKLCGAQAPLNARMVELIQEAEQRQRSGMTGEDLLQALRQVMR
ncbi:MAG: 2-dehydropantoate 2-reductase [Pseudomonadota bacterium]|jgi:2-dehydropantoate 2-reductase